MIRMSTLTTTASRGLPLVFRRSKTRISGPAMSKWRSMSILRSTDSVRCVAPLVSSMKDSGSMTCLLQRRAKMSTNDDDDDRFVSTSYGRSNDDSEERNRRASEYDNSGLTSGVSSERKTGFVRTRSVSRGFENLSNIRYPNPKDESTPEAAKKELLKHLAAQSIRPGEAYNPMDLVSGAQMGGLMSRARYTRVPRPANLIVTGKEIHFTNVWFLSRFLSPMGRIMPRWKTGLSAKNQDKLEKAIKRARQLGLLPYLHRYTHGPLDQSAGEPAPNPLSCPLAYKRKTGVSPSNSRR